MGTGRGKGEAGRRGVRKILSASTPSPTGRQRSPCADARPAPAQMGAPNFEKEGRGRRSSAPKPGAPPQRDAGQLVLALVLLNGQVSSPKGAGGLGSSRGARAQRPHSRTACRFASTGNRGLRRCRLPAWCRPRPAPNIQYLKHYPWITFKFNSNLHAPPEPPSLSPSYYSSATPAPPPRATPLTRGAAQMDRCLGGDLAALFPPGAGPEQIRATVEAATYSDWSGGGAPLVFVRRSLGPGTLDTVLFSFRGVRR
jgi:hypothetical protein